MVLASKQIPESSFAFSFKNTPTKACPSIRIRIEWNPNSSKHEHKSIDESKHVAFLSANTSCGSLMRCGRLTSSL